MMKMKMMKRMRMDERNERSPSGLNTRGSTLRLHAAAPFSALPRPTQGPVKRQVK